MSRWRKKNGVADLEKAKHYIEFEIARLKAETRDGEVFRKGVAAIWSTDENGQPETFEQRAERVTKMLAENTITTAEAWRRMGYRERQDGAGFEPISKPQDEWGDFPFDPEAVAEWENEILERKRRETYPDVVVDAAGRRWIYGCTVCDPGVHGANDHYYHLKGGNGAVWTPESLDIKFGPLQTESGRTLSFLEGDAE